MDFFIELKVIKMLGLSSKTRTRRLSIYCSSSPILASFWESCCFCFSNKLMISSWVSWEYGPVPLASGALKIQLNKQYMLKSQLRGEHLKQPFFYLTHGKWLHKSRREKSSCYLHLNLQVICTSSRSGSVLGLSEVWLLVSGAQGFHCMGPEKKTRSVSLTGISEFVGVEYKAVNFRTLPEDICA